MTNRLSLLVQALRDVAPGVRELRLVDAAGGMLPAWSAGSHVLLDLPLASGVQSNPYSLLGDPEDRSCWRLAVRRAADSRGGSAWIHDTLRAGDRLAAAPPRNLFPLVRTARHHLLVAGGIGITPILAMAYTLHRLGASFEVHHAAADPVHAAYRDELARLATRHAHWHGGGPAGRLRFEALLADRPLGTHLYVCGPAGMIDAARANALALGWPSSHVHAERFLAPATGVPFEVVLARSGRRLVVAPTRSLLETLEAAGVDAPSLCRGGACGRCEATVLGGDGELLHADLVLDAAARRAGRRILPCVSRARGRLVLDL